jgi:hypothetical protein
MKRALLSAVIVVLAYAPPASAWDCPIIVGGVNYGTVRSIIVPYPFDATITEVDVSFTSMCGPLLTLQGVWKCAGGASYYLDSGASAWKALTANNYGSGQPAPKSYVNFDAIMAPSDTDIWGRTGSGNNYTEFKGSWYPNDPVGGAISVGANPLLAKMFIANGCSGQFVGTFGFNVNEEAVMVTTTISIPEPGVVTMLIGAGLALASVALARLRRG